MPMKLKLGVLALVAMLALVPYVAVQAQNSPQAGTNPVQSTQSLYFTTPISSTAAVNNQVTLTIPAPAAGLYNYVCSLTFHASQDGTATAQTNAVTTSTNFNSFALKYSLTATATINFDQQFNWGTPATGCVKSAASATATTFVSPAAGANIAFTWYATYFQAP